MAVEQNSKNGTIRHDVVTGITCCAINAEFAITVTIDDAEANLAISAVVLICGPDADQPLVLVSCLRDVEVVDGLSEDR